MHPTGQRRHARARSAPQSLRTCQAARRTRVFCIPEPHTGGGSHVCSNKREGSRRGWLQHCRNHNVGQRQRAVRREREVQLREAAGRQVVGLARRAQQRKLELARLPRCAMRVIV